MFSGTKASNSNLADPGPFDVGGLVARLLEQNDRDWSLETRMPCGFEILFVVRKREQNINISIQVKGILVKI